MAYCEANSKSENRQERVEAAPLFDSLKTAKYHELITYIVGKIFRENTTTLGWTPLDMTSPENMQRIARAIEKELDNIQAIAATPEEYPNSEYKNISAETFIDIGDEDAGTGILPNFQQFISHYFKFNPIVTTAEFELREDWQEDSQEDNENEATDEGGELYSSEENPGKKEWDKDGQAQSAISLADKEVKTLFRVLPKRVWNEPVYRLTKEQLRNSTLSENEIERRAVQAATEIYTNQEGIPLTADFGPTFNLLLNKLAGTKNWEEFVAKLTDTDTLRIIPEAMDIYNILKLGKSGRDMKPNEINLIIKFYQVFSKPKIPVNSFLFQDKGDGFVISEIPGNRNSVKQKFISNFQTGSVSDSVKPFLKKDEILGFSISPEELLKKNEDGTYAFYPDTSIKRLDFLSLLGITFTGTEFLDTQAKRQDFIDLLTTSTSHLYNSLMARLEAGEVIRDPLTQLTKPYKKSDEVIEKQRVSGQTVKRVVEGEKTHVDALIDFESRYSRINPTLSTRNAEGELQYLVSLDNQLSIATYHLNSAKNLKELYDSSVFANHKHNPTFWNGHIRDFLFDKDGNKITHTFDEYGNEIPVQRRVELGNLSGAKVQNNAKTIAKLERNLSPKEKLRQDINMMLGDGMTDTLRTETSNTFYTVHLTENGRSVSYIRPTGFISNFTGNKQFQFRLFKYLTAEIERIKSYPTKKAENPTITDDYGKFSIFYNLLEVGDRELRTKLLAENLTQDSALFQQFLKAYERELATDLDNLKAQIQEAGLETTSDGENYIISPNVIRKHGAATLDTYLRGFIVNTLIQNIEFATAFSGDPLFFTKKSKDSDPLKDTGEYHKRIKMLSSTGDLASTLSIFDDYKRNSSYESAFYNNYSISGALGTKRLDNSKTFKTQTIVEFKQKDDFAYTQDEMVKGIQASVVKRDGDLGDYREAYIKDELLRDAGKQKPADGQGWFSLDGARDFAQRWGIHTPELETIYKYEGLVFRKFLMSEQETTLSPELEQEYKDLKTLIEGNPEKYGHGVIKAIYSGPNETMTVSSPHYDKFALAPLLPSDIKNNKVLKQLLIDMTKKGISYVKYQSATKLVSTAPVDIDKLADVEKHDEYRTELFKLQIKPKKVQNTSTTIPTQMLKLIFSNLFDEGVAPENVKELYDKYVSTLKGVQRVQTDALLDELGIKPDGINVTKLSQRLVEQARRQGQNSNVIQALTAEEGTLPTAFEQSGFLKQVNAMLSGIADNRLRRFEFTGGDFVLVSNAHREKLNFYAYGEDGTRACDCRITLTKEFSKLLNRKHPDGQPIQTRERLNELLNNEEWRQQNKKELTVLLDRVPTQGPNSMDFALVREFLSPTVGNVIILPDEIVYKSGTDFDYDKEKTLTPALDDDGNYIDFPEGNKEEISRRIEQIKKQLEINTEKINSLRERVRTESLKTQQDVNELRETLKAVSIEQEMYLEFVREGIQHARLYSDTPENYSEFLLKKGNSFIDAIFSSDFDSVKNTLEADKLEYYEAAQRRQELREDIQKTLNDYALLRGQAIEEVETMGERVLIDEFKSLIRNRRHLLENQGNKILRTYEDTLALPEMFAELVIPNSTDIIQPVAFDNGKATNSTVSLPMHSDVFKYQKNLYVKDIYFFAKRMLGPFAVDNTFLQLMQYSGININDGYYRYAEPPRSGETEAEAKKRVKKNNRKYRKINNLLLSDDQLKKLKQGGKLRTSLRRDLEDFMKQHWDSQAINATVDAAKDPWFAMLKIVNQNIGVVNFMKNLGIPFTTIVDFVNQPVLLKFYKLQQEGMSKNNAILKIGEELNLYEVSTVKKPVNAEQYKWIKEDPDITIVKEEKISASEWVVEYEQKIYPEHAWELVELFKTIDGREKLEGGFEHLAKIVNYDKNPTKSFKDNLGKTGFTPDSDAIRTFAHFVMTDQHNQAFRNFQYYFNFDTTKNTTATTIRQKQFQRAQLLEERLYSTEDVLNMEENSILSGYINTNVLQSLYDRIFPIIGKEVVQEVFGNLFKAYNMNFEIRNKKAVRDLPEIINSDFSRALIFNLARQEEKTFIEANKHLLIKEQGKKTVGERLEVLKSLPFYAQLSREFPILESLVVSKHQIKEQTDRNNLKQYTSIENIQLLKPTSETTVEAESTIQQFRQLQNYTVQFTEYTEEKNQEYTKALQRFMNDLFTVGIVQSGLDQTFIGFSEYIPSEIKKKLSTEAMTAFNQLTENEQKAFMQEFQKQFSFNNPRYFPSVHIEGVADPLPNRNDYSSRYKQYIISNQGANSIIAGALATEEFIAEEKVETEVAPEPKIEHIVITDVTRSGTKEPIPTFNVNGKLQNVTGYKLKIKEYPEFEGWVYGNSKDGWFINSKDSDVGSGPFFSSLKDLADSVKIFLNKEMADPKSDKDDLQRHGLYRIENPLETNLPPDTNEKFLTFGDIKRIDAKALYKKIQKIEEPRDATGLALLYIAGGGKIGRESFNTEAVGSVKRASLNTGEKEKLGDSRDVDFITKTGPSIKQVSHSIWDELPEQIQNNISDMDIRDELIDVVSRYSSRLDAAQDYYNRYNNEPPTLFGPPGLPGITLECPKN